MNIKYHIVCGLCIDYTLKTFPLNTLSSIAPDLPLIGNEIYLIKNKAKFNADKVTEKIMTTYRLTHSFVVPLMLFNASFFWGYLIHLTSDLFTHTGRFTAMPFYPFSSWRFPWGRNILK